MKLTLYQLDAFTNKLFSGNPAAVIPLDHWIDEQLMQLIAMENNLSETAFFVPLGTAEPAADFYIRWFTPGGEINLCGHATLASSWVIYNILLHKSREIVFNCQSGILKVREEKDFIAMDFPSWKPERTEDFPEDIAKAVGVKEFLGVYKNRELIVEVDSEEQVRKAKPDFAKIKASGYKMILTAAGKEVDFVSRFFAPTLGIDEDPVTGSAHSQLIPFWSEKLGKTKMKAKQLSARGGELICELNGDRVMMGGNCVFYMKGEIEV